MCNVHLCTWLIDILLFCIWPLHLFGCPAFLLVHCHVALPVSCCPDCLLFSGSSCCILPVYSFVLCSLFVLSVYFSPSSFCAVCLLLSVVLLHVYVLFFCSTLCLLLSVVLLPAYCSLISCGYCLSFTLRWLTVCLLFLSSCSTLCLLLSVVLLPAYCSLISCWYYPGLGTAFFPVQNVRSFPFF